MLTTIVTTIIVLGILIFIHEFGHFIVAKLSGVTVLRFSFGFGPRLVGVKRGDTDYCISAIPLGGYVKMLGEESEEELTEEQLARSFSSQPVRKRMLIVLAGPVSNLLLAIVIFTLVTTFYGIPHMTADIGTVAPGSPAETAGMMAGDKVTAINGQTVNRWEDLPRMIEAFGEQSVMLQVQRGQDLISVQLTPKVSETKNLFGETIRRPVIGVSPSGKFVIEKVNPVYAGYYSLVQTWEMSKLLLTVVVKLFQRVIPLDTLGGPILIGQMVGQQAQEGFLNLIIFVAGISVQLGVLNLLPIPILDGGHLLFFTLEAILGRPIEMKKIEIAQRVGMLILLTLMIVVFYNDIMRLLPGSKLPLTP